MGGPTWLTAIFAAASLTVAVYCAGRLAAARRWHRPTELDTDGAHVVMGVAMAGMLVSGLRTLPSAIWVVVFAAGAAWFGYRMLQARRGAQPSPWRSSHPLPHLVECAAMLYMLLALPGSRPAGAGAGTPMPGMGGSPGAAGAFPALAVVLALFMVGYVVWTTDQLASMARARTAVTAAWHQHAGASLMLAPRLAACYKIAMGITMGYMLIPMF
jgi:hypothetical protein